MYQISRRTPAYLLTSVAHNRLPVFRTDKIKRIVCAALDEARKNHDILIFAYVIMPDHSHLVTDGRKPDSDVLRYLNGVTAKRVLDHLKRNNFASSLAKLRREEAERNRKYTLFHHHPNAFEIKGEDTLMQKVNYVHLNPVRAGLVAHPDEYLYSSARQWHGRELDEEPFVTDHKQIKWRAA